MPGIRNYKGIFTKHHDIRTFKIGEKIYDVPKKDVDEFARNFPEAEEVETYTMGGKKYDVPIEDINEFTGEFPEAERFFKDKNTVGRAIEVGSAMIGKFVAETPSLLYDTFAIPQNAVSDPESPLYIPGLEWLHTDSETVAELAGLPENKVADYYGKIIDESAKDMQAEFDKTIDQYIANGEWGKAAKLTGLSIAQSAPITLSLMMGNAAGATPLVSTLAGGLLFSAGEYADVKDDPTLSTPQKLINSYAKGIFEGAFEQVGLTKLGNLYKKILTKEGPKVAHDLVKKTFYETYLPILKKYTRIGAEESISEGFTRFFGNLVDKYSGNRPDMDITEGVVNDAIVGLGSSVVFSGPGAGIETASARRGRTFRDVELTEEERAPVLDFGDAAQEEGPVEVNIPAPQQQEVQEEEVVEPAPAEPTPVEEDLKIVSSKFTEGADDTSTVDQGADLETLKREKGKIERRRDEQNGYITKRKQRTLDKLNRVIAKKEGRPTTGRVTFKNVEGKEVEGFVNEKGEVFKIKKDGNVSKMKHAERNQGLAIDEFFKVTETPVKKKAPTEPPVSKDKLVLSGRNVVIETDKETGETTTFVTDKEGKVIPSIEQVESNALNRGVELDLSETDGNIRVSNIKTSEDQRGQGKARETMEELIEYADDSGKSISLTPTSEFGASKPRLEKFYRSLGFVPNKGGNKDFKTKDTFIRPAKKPAEKVTPPKTETKQTDKELLESLNVRQDKSYTLNQPDGTLRNRYRVGDKDGNEIAEAQIDFKPDGTAFISNVRKFSDVERKGAGRLAFIKASEFIAESGSSPVIDSRITGKGFDMLKVLENEGFVKQVRKVEKPKDRDLFTDYKTPVFEYTDKITKKETPTPTKPKETIQPTTEVPGLTEAFAKVDKDEGVAEIGDSGITLSKTGDKYKLKYTDKKEGPTEKFQLNKKEVSNIVEKQLQEQKTPDKPKEPTPVRRTADEKKAIIGNVNALPFAPELKESASINKEIERSKDTIAELDAKYKATKFSTALDGKSTRSKKIQGKILKLDKAEVELNKNKDDLTGSLPLGKEKYQRAYDQARGELKGLLAPLGLSTVIDDVVRYSRNQRQLEALEKTPATKKPAKKKTPVDKGEIVTPKTDPATALNKAVDTGSVKVVPVSKTRRPTKARSEKNFGAKIGNEYLFLREFIPNHMIVGNHRFNASEGVWYDRSSGKPASLSVANRLTNNFIKQEKQKRDAENESKGKLLQQSGEDVSGTETNLQKGADTRTQEQPVKGKQGDSKLKGGRSQVGTDTKSPILTVGKRKVRIVKVGDKYFRVNEDGTPNEKAEVVNPKLIAEYNKKVRRDKEKEVKEGEVTDDVKAEVKERIKKGESSGQIIRELSNKYDIRGSELVKIVPKTTPSKIKLPKGSKLKQLKNGFVFIPSNLVSMQLNDSEFVLFDEENNGILLDPRNNAHINTINKIIENSQESKEVIDKLDCDL